MARRRGRHDHVGITRESA